MATEYPDAPLATGTKRPPIPPAPAPAPLVEAPVLLAADPVVVALALCLVLAFITKLLLGLYLRA